MKSLAKRILEDINSINYQEYSDNYNFSNKKIPNEIKNKFADEIIDCLVSDFGWEKREYGGADKNVGGGLTGDLNPYGNRVVTARAKDGMVYAEFGGDTITTVSELGTIINFDQTPQAYAKYFNNKVNKWAEFTRNNK